MIANKVWIRSKTKSLRAQSGELQHTDGPNRSRQESFRQLLTAAWMNKRTRAETFFILVAAELFCHIHERPAQITQSEKKRNIRLCAGEMEIWRLPSYLIYLWFSFLKLHIGRTPTLLAAALAFQTWLYSRLMFFLTWSDVTNRAKWVCLISSRAVK